LRAVRHLRTTVDALVVQLADTVAPRVMPQGEAFTFFRRLLNYTPGKAEAIPYRGDAPLDFTVGDSTVEGHRDHLRVDDHVVRVLTLKMPPAFTHAYLLADLATLPTAAIVCLEWQRISKPDATRSTDVCCTSSGEDVTRELRRPTRGPRDAADDSRRRPWANPGTRLTAMEVEGAFFGQMSLTIVLYDRDARRSSVAACLKLFDGTTPPPRRAP
jgi:type IV secretion system protein VirB4